MAVRRSGAFTETPLASAFTHIPISDTWWHALHVLGPRVDDVQVAARDADGRKVRGGFDAIRDNGMLGAAQRLRATP